MHITVLSVDAHFTIIEVFLDQANCWLGSIFVVGKANKTIFSITCNQRKCWHRLGSSDSHIYRIKRHVNRFGCLSCEDRSGRKELTCVTTIEALNRLSFVVKQDESSIY
ncbi:hypothetical protein D3C81_1819340 [compost metagenome]